MEAVKTIYVMAILGTCFNMNDSYLFLIVCIPTYRGDLISGVNSYNRTHALILYRDHILVHGGAPPHAPKCCPPPQTTGVGKITECNLIPRLLIVTEPTRVTTTINFTPCMITWINSIYASCIVRDLHP